MIEKSYSTIRNISKDKQPYFDKNFNVKNSNFLKSGGLRTLEHFKKSSEDNPLISIITTSLNSSKTIEKTILSVLTQTYDNIEFIIIDGDSTDGTLEIIKKYEKYIDFWISEKDRGIFHGINKGIKISTGDIIGILNSDDIYTKNALFLTKKYFDKKIDYLFGSVWKDRLLTGFNKNKIQWKFNIFPGHSSGFFITKNAQLKVGLYDEEFKLHADYDLVFKLVHKLELNGISMDKDHVTGIFNLEGKSSKENIFQYFYEEFKIRKKNKQNLIFISFLFLIKITHSFLLKVRIFKKLFNFLKKKIKFLNKI